jgi:hypothetical protein
MLKTMSFVAASVLLSGSAWASGFQISQLDVRGDCAGDDIRIVEEAGKYYLEAQFTEMNAFAPFGDYDKKNCNLRYNVDLPYGYKLDLFQFSVDGIADISERGLGRLTISHRVENLSPVRSTFRFREGFTDFSDLTGEIFGWDLAPQYQSCGTSVPLKTDLYVSARTGSRDSFESVVDLDAGVSSGYVRFCQIKVKPCP